MPRCLTCLLAFMLAAAAPWPSRADDRTGHTAADAWTWALAQLRQGHEADLAVFCGVDTKPAAAGSDHAQGSNDPNGAEAARKEKCLTVDAAALRSLLISESQMDELPHGVRLYHVHIRGPLDLENAHLRGELRIDDSFIDGDLILAEGTADSIVRFDGTVIGGDLIGDGAHFHATVNFRTRAVVRGRTSFVAAHFDSDLAMRQAEFDDDVVLNGSHIDKSLLLDGAIFRGNLDATSAVIGHQLSIDYATFSQARDAHDSHILFAQAATVGADVFLRHTMLPSRLDLTSAHIGGSTSLTGSSMTAVTLEGAHIGTDFILGENDGLPKWIKSGRDAPFLDLHNTSVGNLQVTEGAWPPGPSLKLGGFTYAHLGSLEFDGSDHGVMSRKMSWWRRWLKQDPHFDMQPYTQLAQVMTAAGDPDRASEILFFGRDRQRDEAGRGCLWLQALHLVPSDDATPKAEACRFPEWLKLSLLQATIGYGIGNYTFRAVGWIAALALVGTTVLAFAPGVRGPRYRGHGLRGPRQKSLLWCLGASLSHILPVVSLSPEFTDFFNDPQRRRLHAWQHVIFAMLVILGWVLGVVLLAAFSGITQK